MKKVTFKAKSNKTGFKKHAKINFKIQEFFS